MGLRGKRSTLHIIDFGLAVPYYIPEMDEHITLTGGQGLTGTARYASVNAHKGLQLSRRDNLESAAYLLLYFAAGCLPWQGLKRKNGASSSLRVSKQKQTADLFLFCEARGLPREFAVIVRYARGLAYTQRPDYDHVRRTYRGVFDTQGFADDGLFDWTASPERKQSLQPRGNAGSYDGSEFCLPYIFRPQAFISV